MCLGAQLIAEVLGAKVYKNTYREIGWMPVHKTEQAKQMPLLSSLPDSWDVFHWHGDTFDLPNGAVNILSSEACLNQGFIYGNNVLALQFHMEMTIDAIKVIAEKCQNELTEGPYIKEESSFYNEDMIVKNNQWMFQLLNKFTQES